MDVSTKATNVGVSIIVANKCPLNVTTTTTTSTTTTSTTKTTTTTSTTSIDCKTVRTEGTEVITEESSYNPNTKELTISVPSHGNREAATFIIGEIVTSIVYPQECLISDTTQSDQDLLNGAENTGDGCKDTVELKESDLDNRYSFSIVLRVLSGEDIAQLPKSIQDACKGKTVRRTTSIVVDEETFNNTDTFIDGTSFDGCNPTTTQSPGCLNKRVSNS